MSYSADGVSYASGRASESRILRTQIAIGGASAFPRQNVGPVGENDTRQKGPSCCPDGGHDPQEGKFQESKIAENIRQDEDWRQSELPMQYKVHMMRIRRLPHWHTLENPGGENDKEKVDGEERYLNEVAEPQAVTHGERSHRNRNQQRDDEHLAAEEYSPHYLPHSQCRKIKLLAPMSWIGPSNLAEYKQGWVSIWRRRYRIHYRKSVL
ncbi:hypothetical protein C8J57DRAFT_1320795 [Mycena rebaudengoi]|nr:hypothetical protein C8J57DRAFT_1320795 [Mycena rebaudengoi]